MTTIKQMVEEVLSDIERLFYSIPDDGASASPAATATPAADSSSPAAAAVPAPAADKATS